MTSVPLGTATVKSAPFTPLAYSCSPVQNEGNENIRVNIRGRYAASLEVELYRQIYIKKILYIVYTLILIDFMRFR